MISFNSHHLTVSLHQFKPTNLPNLENEIDSKLKSIKSRFSIIGIFSILTATVSLIAGEKFRIYTFVSSLVTFASFRILSQIKRNDVKKEILTFSNHFLHAKRGCFSFDFNLLSLLFFGIYEEAKYFLPHVEGYRFHKIFSSEHHSIAMSKLDELGLATRENCVSKGHITTNDSWLTEDMLKPHSSSSDEKTDEKSNEEPIEYTPNEKELLDYVERSKKNFSLKAQYITNL